MLTQFIRCYIHPVNGTIDHVYCNDQGRQPDRDPMTVKDLTYDIVDLTVWTDAYMRPAVVKEHLQYANGVVTFQQRPTAAKQDLNQVVNKRSQAAPQAVTPREREGMV